MHRILLLLMLATGVLRVVRHGQSYLVFEDLFYTNASASLDLLLRSLLVLFSHVHDGSGF